MSHTARLRMAYTLLGVFILGDNFATAMDVPSRPLKRRAGSFDELPAPKQLKIEGQNFQRKYLPHPETKAPQEDQQELSGRRKVRVKKSEIVPSSAPVLGLNVQQEPDTEEEGEKFSYWRTNEESEEDDDDDFLFKLDSLSFESKQ